MAINLTRYAQRNQIWSGDQLGHGVKESGDPITIGEAGAVVCSLAAIVHQAPGDVNCILRNANAFDPDNPAMLDIDKLPYGDVFDGRLRHEDESLEYYGTNKMPLEEIERLKKWVRSGKPAIVMVEVQLPPKPNPPYNYMAVSDVDADGNILVFDAWYYPEEDESDVTQRYVRTSSENPGPEDAIVRFNLFEFDEGSNGATKLSVYGRILQPNGEPVSVEGYTVKVKAYDKDLSCCQNLLGETTTGAEGAYRIGYKSSQLCRPAKKRADLLVFASRVEGESEDEIAASPLTPAESDDQVVDLIYTGYQAPDAYTLLKKEVDTQLHDIEYTNLCDKDINYLAVKTGLDYQQIEWLALSHKLADEAKDPVAQAKLMSTKAEDIFAEDALTAEVFNAFARQGLETDLDALIDQDPDLSFILHLILEIFGNLWTFNNRKERQRCGILVNLCQ